jgi:hypothetical protein
MRDWSTEVSRRASSREPPLRLHGGSILQSHGTAGLHAAPFRRFGQPRKASPARPTPMMGMRTRSCGINPRACLDLPKGPVR